MSPQSFSCASAGITATQLSYRDLEEMMRERGLSVGHATVFHQVQHYAPEINKQMRPHLKMSRTSYRIDGTYVKVPQ